MNPDPWAPRSGPIRLVPPTGPLVGRPLLIVDGEEIPLDRSRALDPGRIVSIQMVESAKAVAAYGARAADGVILVRTKRR